MLYLLLQPLLREQTSDKSSQMRTNYLFEDVTQRACTHIDIQVHHHHIIIILIIIVENNPAWEYGNIKSAFAPKNLSVIVYHSRQRQHRQGREQLISTAATSTRATSKTYGSYIPASC